MEEYKIYIGQILVQAGLAGMYIIVRIAFDNGMNRYVYLAYRQAVATLVMAPIAYFLERNERPPLTCTIFWQIFLLALAGISVSQNLFFIGLAYTSATFAAAISNLLPIFTSVMTIAFRYEKVDIRTKRGQAKIIGTVICVGGAMIMTLYKGSTIVLTKTLLLKLSTWFLGAASLFVCLLFLSAYLTLQVPVLKEYPAKKSFLALVFLLATLQSTVMALIFEPNISSWKINWDMDLLSIVYSALLGSVFTFFVQTYSIKEKGPIFPVLFYPLSTIIVAVLELTIFHSNLHLGSVVGGVLTIAGLYIALWGKGNDKEETKPLEETRPLEDGVEDGCTNSIEDCTVEIQQPC
ncbi:WAT1-related protein At1g21890 [Cryptomeria japonica]|uniref:WAT1-related protein At1g21890 n=1 Tax=Cryptomeria japonica TaxID=3369 RepID=UPI0027DA4FAB|nr:WAT1-related protein At1g21890 [Cryptomeria japonica]